MKFHDYYAKEAHYNRNKSNRSGHSKINENIDLKNYIYEKLDQGWPPEVIADRWNLLESRVKAPLPATEADLIKTSHESIYAWVYEQDGALYLKLPCKKRNEG